MATPKQTFIKKIAGTKARAESGLQSVGGQIRKNLADGQRKSFDHSTVINPLKGALDAYKRGYGG